MTEKPLPYDAEIEYLGGSGTQYIDLGRKAKTTLKIEVKFNLGTNATQAIFGCVESKYGMFLGTSSNGSVFCNYTDTAVSPSRTLSANTDYVVIHQDTSLNINDLTNTVNATRATNNTIILFARRLDGVVQRMITGKI